MEEKSEKLKSEITQKWVNAAIALCNDIDAEVLCPVCGEENLKAEDIIIPDRDKFERMLYCPKCNAVNFMLMTKK